MITITQHDKTEWARMAQDAYRTGHNLEGHRFSAAAASLPVGAQLSAERFDSLMTAYRAWLIGGWE